MPEKNNTKEEMSGAAHRAMKDTITRLEEKVDVSIDKFDNRLSKLMQDIEIKFDNLYKKLDVLNTVLPNVSVAEGVTLSGRSNNGPYIVSEKLLTKIF